MSGDPCALSASILDSEEQLRLCKVVEQAQRDELRDDNLEKDQCWRCHGFGHKSHEKVCPLYHIGRKLAETERRMRLDPMANVTETSVRPIASLERLRILRSVVGRIKEIDSSSSAHSSRRRERKRNKKKKKSRKRQLRKRKRKRERRRRHDTESDEDDEGPPRKRRKYR